MVSYNPHERMARVLKEVAGRDIFLFPVGWGSAMEANILQGYLDQEGVRAIRYDLKIPDYGNRKRRLRRVINNPIQVVQELSEGISRRITPDGYVTEDIEPILFERRRALVPLEDYVRYTGYGLLGGMEFAGKIRPFVNGSKIIPAAMNCDTSLILPEGFTPDMTRYIRPMIVPWHLLTLPDVSPLLTTPRQVVSV